MINEGVKTDLKGSHLKPPSKHYLQVTLLIKGEKIGAESFPVHLQSKMH